MYYSHPCSYCSKIFYTFSPTREAAAETLYLNIKKHLKEYNEDNKEHVFDEDPSIVTQEVYDHISESNEPPAGGYEIT